MEYKKIDATLKERFIFLFTGLISKKYLEEKTEVISFSQSKQEEKVCINNKEEGQVDALDFKPDIPFFDLDPSKTKSNL